MPGKRGRGGSRGPHPRRAPSKPAKKSGGCVLAVPAIPLVALLMLGRYLVARVFGGAS